ncbi:MAG: co-chaperone GroES [Holosporaceae bacterium]|jgi:chaperonin GroES|nr:co-chaperone GroES [Holosporaceae bacterium]
MVVLDKLELKMAKIVDFIPLKDRVLIKRIDQEEKSPGGIIIPDTAKEKPAEGEVLAIGQGARDDHGVVHALDVKVGDRVFFAKWGGNEVKIRGEEYIILKESDILGILK